MHIDKEEMREMFMRAANLAVDAPFYTGNIIYSFVCGGLRLIRLDAQESGKRSGIPNNRIATELENFEHPATCCVVATMNDGFCEFVNITQKGGGVQ